LAFLILLVLSIFFWRWLPVIYGHLGGVLFGFGLAMDMDMDTRIPSFELNFPYCHLTALYTGVVESQ
jgi:hypothetical protein